MLWKILLSLALVPIVYLVIAFVLVMFPPRIGNAKSLNFDHLRGSFDRSQREKPLAFSARDGAPIAYRRYPSDSSKTLILLHGSGYHGDYLEPLARGLADRGAARVYVPNLRGHSGSGRRRGDIGHVGQLEEDLADLVERIETEHPDTTIVMGGHSSGGAMAIRFAASPYGGRVSSYLALSPILGHKAPTVVEGNGGWAFISLPRIIGLSMLNGVGIHMFDHLETIRFNMPSEFRDGTETLGYSWRLMTNFNLHTDFRSDLEKLPASSLTIVGRDDEAMNAEAFISLFNELDKTVELINQQDHFSLVLSEPTVERVDQWLKTLPETE